MNNTLNHVSDQSVYVKFDPTGTDWPTTVVNVQAALADIGSWARKSKGLPVAAAGVAGIAQIATQEEVTAGTDNTKIVTPALLAFRLQNPKASQTVWGYTKYATDAQATTVGEDTVSITPRSADVIFKNRNAKETQWGSAKLSTTAQATAGIDDTTSMTPLKTKQAIAALVPVQSNANESTFGLVRLATVAEVRAGTIREGYAISPYTFTRLTATQTAPGLLVLANATEVAIGTDAAKAVTPATLMAMKGSGGQFGIVKLSTTVNAGLANTALSSGAAVLASDRNQVINGGLYQFAGGDWNKYQTAGEVDLSMPIGGIILTGFNSDHGNLMVCNGRSLNKNQYAMLFQRIGYTFGGGGDWFNIPDMRGLVARGTDNGRGMDPGRGHGSYQEDTMQQITGNFTMDDQAVTTEVPPSGAFYVVGKGVNYDADSNGRRLAYHVAFDSARQTRVSGETRAKSLALNYVIRIQ